MNNIISLSEHIQGWIGCKNFVLAASSIKAEWELLNFLFNWISLAIPLTCRNKVRPLNYSVFKLNRRYTSQKQIRGLLNSQPPVKSPKITPVTTDLCRLQPSHFKFTVFFFFLIILNHRITSMFVSSTHKNQTFPTQLRRIRLLWWLAGRREI